MNFDSRLGGTVIELFAKFQIDFKVLTQDPKVSGLWDILRDDVLLFGKIRYRIMY